MKLVISLRTSAVAIFIFLVLILVVIFDSNDNRRGSYPPRNPAKHDSPFRGISDITPNSSESIFTLSQSKWNCKNKTAIEERNLDCRRRLPDVIGIGAKKGGTGALIFFLSNHPAIHVAAVGETHQWDWHPKRSIDRYRNLMPITSQYQFTMEKTPAYFVADDIPAKIARDVSPDIKILLILRDPVKRAISDYSHILDLYPKMARRNQDGTRRRGRRPVYPRANISYVIKETFEKSMLNEDGTVNTDNAIIFTGLYARHLQNWFKVFPREQILILDGDLFSKDPIPQLQTIESFLGLPKYFTANKIYFNEAKGFFCLAVPFKHCMGEGKGRKHPDVDRDTLTKLYRFYQPYNEELEILTGRKFSWMKPH